MGKRGKVAAGIAVAGLAAAAVVAWQLRSTEIPLATPPEIPAAVADAEVRAALAEARQKVIAQPRSDQAWGGLGLVFRAHKFHPESIACFAEAAKLNAATPVWPYMIGSVKLEIEPDAALPFFRTAYALATQPDDRESTRLQLADLLLDRNELEEAAKLFEQQLAETRQNPRCHYGLGVIALRQGNRSTATTHLALAALSPYSRQKASALLATCYHQLGRGEEARQFEQEALRPPADQPWPNSLAFNATTLQVGPVARNLMVHELQTSGRHLEAVKTLQEMASGQLGEQDELSLGISLGMLGKWPEAEKVFRSALGKQSTHATARLCLGLALYYQALAVPKASGTVARKQFEAAISEFDRAIEQKPDSGQAYLYKGYCLKNLGRLAEAAEQCRRAIQVLPQSADAHFALGEVEYELGHPGQAAVHLQDAVRLSPPGDDRASKLLRAIRGKE